MGVAIVIGANRGIGLGFTQQCLQAGYDVVATYRDESKLNEETVISGKIKECEEECEEESEEVYKESLAHLKEVYKEKLTLYQLEIKNIDEINRFAQTIAKVDLLILNAGIKGYTEKGIKPEDHQPEDLLEAFLVNTHAPDNIVRALFPIVSKQADAVIGYMSSLVGLTEDNESGDMHPYRGTKAGSNSLMWNWSISLMRKWKNDNPKNLTRTPCALAICPGWVRTDMGGPNARLSIKQSVSSMMIVIEDVRKSKKSNGLYMHDGKVAEAYKPSKELTEILQEIEKETL